MTKLRGSQNGSLLIPLILFIMLFIGAAGFGVWAFMGRQDYKNNVDAKIDKATTMAVKKSEKKQEAEFIQREKRPLRTYRGPQSLGSVALKYPKTWSIYADELQDGELTVLGHPKYVPADDGGNQAYALKVEVLSQAYDETASDYEDAVKDGMAKARPYKLPKRKSVTGLRVDGSVDDDHRGVAVILPLRDKTLVISTLSDQYVDDFDSIILKQFNFIP